MAAGPVGRCRLRAHGRADHLALPEAAARLAAVRREPALGDAGRRRLQHLGARRGRPRFRLLGPRGRLGITPAGLARLHRVDHGLPHLPRRPPAITPMALGSVDHGGRPRPAHPGHVDRPPRRVRVRAGVRLPQHLRAAAHRRSHSRRGRSDRLCRVHGAAPSQGHGTTNAASSCGSHRPPSSWRSASWSSFWFRVSRARRGPGWPRCRCGSPSSRSRSASRSRCCDTVCSRST